jgi:hypothetical protein
MATKNSIPQNRSASIRTREDRRGKLRTETFRRDEDSVNVAVSTNPRTDSTMLYIDTPEGDTYRFDGRTARTLYRALQKHYQFTGKSV